MFSKLFTVLLLCFSLNTIYSCNVQDMEYQNNMIVVPNDSFIKTGNFIIFKIILTGNKVTKQAIIFRELLFHENDTIHVEKLSQLMEQSRKNLLNTSLFNFVTIDTSSIEPGRINVSIDVIERWYVWPMPFFQLSDRNFNVWWKTKDFSKTDYGLYLTWDNFRGRKESVVLLLRMGYDQTYSLSYKIPYINKRKTLGIGITGGFSGNHEVPYQTDTNKQVYYKNNVNYVQQNIFSSFNIIFRRNIFNSHIFQVNYNDYRFSDSLLIKNPGFAKQSHIQYFTFYYLFKNDHRDFKTYPLNGYYFDLEFVKNGFGILKQENIDMAYIHSSYRIFRSLCKRCYFAGSINAKISTKSFQPYFLEKGLGYGNDFVRSYEYYVVDGQDFILLKSNIKYELIPTKVREIKFIPTKKFSKFYYALYLNIIADAAYVNNRQVAGYNPLTDSPLFGTGIGLDFVTYYDKILRVEYTIHKKIYTKNDENDNKFERGIFLHFISPI